jgi:hypothetical protein
VNLDVLARFTPDSQENLAKAIHDSEPNAKSVKYAG